MPGMENITRFRSFIVTAVACALVASLLVYDALEKQTDHDLSSVTDLLNLQALRDGVMWSHDKSASASSLDPASESADSAIRRKDKEWIQHAEALERSADEKLRRGERLKRLMHGILQDFAPGKDGGGKEQRDRGSGGYGPAFKTAREGERVAEGAEGFRGRDFAASNSTRTRLQSAGEGGGEEEEGSGEGGGGGGEEEMEGERMGEAWRRAQQAFKGQIQRQVDLQELAKKLLLPLPPLNASLPRSLAPSLSGPPSSSSSLLTTDERGAGAGREEEGGERSKRGEQSSIALGGRGWGERGGRTGEAAEDGETRGAGAGGEDAGGGAEAGGGGADARVRASGGRGAKESKEEEEEALEQRIAAHVHLQSKFQHAADVLGKAVQHFKSTQGKQAQELSGEQLTQPHWQTEMYL